MAATGCPRCGWPRLSPDNPDIAAALDQSEARNGFRVTDTQIGRMAAPRFARCCRATCPVHRLRAVPAPARGRSDGRASGPQLCIGGLTRGQNVELTLRAGLPAADGEVLARDVALKGYIRDRAPRGPLSRPRLCAARLGDQRLSMVTVNADRVDLRLLRISDRNLIRTMSESMFAVPLDSWQAEYSRTRWHGKSGKARPRSRARWGRTPSTAN